MSAARTPLATSIATPVFACFLALGMICALGAARAGRPPPAQEPPTPLPRPVFAAYLAGKLSAYEGDWDAAADAVAEAAAAAPDQPMIAVELARVQMKAKRTGGAIATLARARA